MKYCLQSLAYAALVELISFGVQMTHLQAVPGYSEPEPWGSGVDQDSLSVQCS